MSNIKCNAVHCDHNTGFTKECMFNVTDKLIGIAKSNGPMCSVLKARILKELAHKAINTNKEVLRNAIENSENNKPT